MLYRRRKDIILPTAQPSGTAAQTLTFRIKQEQRRLDGFIFRLNLTPNAVAATGAAWGGYGGIVKEIRVRVNDVIGTRNAVQVSGTGILSWVRENLGFLDRDTQSVYGSAGFPLVASTATINTSWYVPLRHPLVDEPYGNYLSLPLSQKYLGDDVIVEVDLWDIAAAGTVFTATPPTYTAGTSASILTLVREVPESWGYIPSELRTDTWIPSVVSNAAYEFTSNGYLTSALFQGFSGSTYGNAITRKAMVAAGGQMRFEYGREILMREDESFNQVLNDLSKQTYPSQVLANIAASNLKDRFFTGENMFDFLADLPSNGAFSVASVPNLYTSALGGDKARVILNDASASMFASVTMHRLLPAKADDLKGLAANLG